MGNEKKNMLLPQTLRALREAAGCSQQKIAEKLQITRSAYTYYELGTTVPDIYKIRSLAQLYGLTIEDLLDGKINKACYLMVNYNFPNAS